MARKKILLIRSASYGDYIVIFPQLKVFLEKYLLKINDITFLIFNKDNVNPAKMIFGEDSEINKNTYVIQNSNIIFYIFSLIKLRFTLGQFEKIFYLNYVIEDKKLKFFKSIVLKILWFNSKHFGFEIKNKYSHSHYFSPFQGIEINKTNLTNYTNWFLDFVPAKNIVNRFNSFNNKNQLIIGIYCHGKMSAKIWPKENYIALIIEINKAYNAIFYLIGAKEDKSYHTQIQEELFNQGIQNVYNKSGDLTIPETIDFMRHLSCFITNDGLPMHLAAIANCPTIAIYTYREEIGAWDPVFINKFISIRTNVTCNKCYSAYCPNPVCISKTLPSDIFQYVNEILDSNEVKKSIVIYPDNSFLNYKTPCC